jgi:cytochrome c biogenesis factor
VLHGGPVLAPFGIGLAVFAMAGAVTDLAERAGVGRVAPSVALARARGLPRSAFGTAIAHFGLGVSLFGDRLRLDLGRRTDRLGQTAGDGVAALIRFDIRRSDRSSGPELSRAVGALHRAPWW